MPRSHGAGSDRSSTRVVAAGVAGLVGALPAGLAGRWAYAPAVGWDAAALLFLLWTWAVIGRMDAETTETHAKREDPSRGTSQVIVLCASVASLAAVGGLLVRASGQSGLERGVVAGLGVLSVAVSWIVVHTLFTLHYALLYYRPDPVHRAAPSASAETGNGIEFNQHQQPHYRDFAYVAFTVGMTFQVSDTTLTSDRLRATVLKHALLSFVFGAVILAATVNVVASLASSNH